MRVIQFLCAFVWVVVVAGCSSSSPGGQAQKPESQVIIHTSLGPVSIRLFDDTPIHRDNFLKLARQGFFDSLTFHRVLHNFVVQSGDPRSRTSTWSDSVMGPGYDLPAEFTEHHVHVRGALAAARKPEAENPQRMSSGSQFYFVTGMPQPEARLDSMEAVATGIRKGNAFLEFERQREAGSFQGSFQDFLASHPVNPFRYTAAQRKAYLETGGAPFLDFSYTVFGEVVDGMETVMKISRQPAKDGMLLDDVRIDSVTIHP